MKTQNKLPRREFLQLMAATALAPWTARFAQRSHPDVVIVGAGAAGLAAARKLASLGRTFLVVEAMDRIGGRAYTETTTFGVPFDHGAHWLHNGLRNPFNGYARRRGFDIYLPETEERFFVGDRPANVRELRRSPATLSATGQAIAAASAQGDDVSLASIAPKVNEWDPTTELLLGPSLAGLQFDDLSTLDYLNLEAEGGLDWRSAQGYGAIVADFGRAVPVELNTPVELIDWSGDGVEVHTPSGIIRAGAVIVTVAPAVLASGAITFQPPLPTAVADAASHIGMATYNHIALQFSENVLQSGPDGFMMYKSDTGRGASILANIADTLLTFVEVGGTVGADLELASDKVAVDFALGELEAIFGSSVREKVVTSFVTRWGQNPYTLGGWSNAKPGFFDSRRTLRQRAAIGDRIFLAGEALHPTMYSTVAGAALTGHHMARQVDRVLVGRTYEPLVAAPADKPLQLRGPAGRLASIASDE